MTRPVLKTFAVVLAVGLAACHRSNHVDTELDLLPTSPVVSIHRLSKFSPCVGSFVERTTCELRGPPETNCIYGVVHTVDRPALPVDCAMVSGWPGPPSDSDAYRFPSDSVRSATGNTFMIREPGVDTTVEYRHATVPDAGLRLNVTLGGGGRSRLHHIDSSGVFYSHESQWSEDAGSLEAPLAKLLGPSFWSMRPEQREEAWPVILREDPKGAPLVLWEGHEEPDYEGFLATLSDPQREALLSYERFWFEYWVDEAPSPMGGWSGLDLVEMSYSRWVFKHQDREPEWFLPLAKRAAKTQPHLFNEYLALRGDREAADRVCANDGDSDESLAIFALTGHQCSKVVQMGEAPKELFGLVAHGGAPCSVDEARARARALMEHVLPRSLQVDAGVQPREGCGPFLAALAVQRKVPPGMRRRFERMHYEIVRLGAWCRDVEDEVLGLPGTVNRKVYTSADDTCELIIDDRKRTVRVTGVAPPPPVDDDADE